MACIAANNVDTEMAAFRRILQKTSWGIVINKRQSQ